MENKELVVHEKGQLVAMEFTEAQVDLIKRTIAKGASNDQLALFLYTCKRTGLDPLAKQIHCVIRQTKNGPVMSLQTAIDGYRLTADRTGKYAGNDDPIYDNEEKPRKATVTVYKLVNGIRCPFTATARWEQYYPGDIQGFMWKKMPHLMLGKCAEALALRKAFPAELSGVYTKEEMEQADVQIVPPTIAPSAPLPREVATVEAEEVDLAKVAEQAKVRLEEMRKAEAVANPPKEATKNEQESPKVADLANHGNPVQKVLKGLIAAYYAPKGKGPHKWYIQGEYCQSFDEDIATTLNGHRQKEDEVEVAVHVSTSTNKTTGQVYENLVVDQIFTKE